MGLGNNSVFEFAELYFAHLVVDHKKFAGVGTDGNGPAGDLGFRGGDVDGVSDEAHYGPCHCCPEALDVYVLPLKVQDLRAS